MNINVDRIDKTVAVLTLSGRLDTANAPLLERKLKQFGDEITEVTLDFSELEYISSMGLRVLLQAKKAMNEKKVAFAIKNMRESVREVFEMTGFINLMVQEEKFVMVRKDESDHIVLSLNGEMRTEQIPSLEKELSGLQDHPALNHAVVLDMEKLAYISPNACKLLSHAVADFVKDRRKLCIGNVPDDVRRLLEAHGMGKYIQ